MELHHLPRRPPKFDLVISLQALTGVGEPELVLAVEVLPVGARGDALPPGAVLQVPSDGVIEALLEGVRGCSAEVAFGLGRVDGVTAVVAGAILNVLDEALRLAHALQDAFDDVDVL